MATARGCADRRASSGRRVAPRALEWRGRCAYLSRVRASRPSTPPMRKDPTMIAKTLTRAGLAATLVTGTALSASPIDGRWNCHEQMNRNGLKGTIDSVTDLGPDGKMRMALVMNARKVVVPVRAEATYSARWKLEGGKLYEQAEGAQVTSFTIAGVDSLDSEHAADFKAEMLTPGTPPDVVILSDNKIEFRLPDRLTTCTR